MKRITINGKLVKLTDEQFLEYEAQKEAERIANLSYKEKREREYPKIGDQLDVIWKQFNQLRLDGTPLIQEADDILGSILSTKNKHPKPEGEE